LLLLPTVFAAKYWNPTGYVVNTGADISLCVGVDSFNPSTGELDCSSWISSSSLENHDGDTWTLSSAAPTMLIRTQFNEDFRTLITGMATSRSSCLVIRQDLNGDGIYERNHMSKCYDPEQEVWFVAEDIMEENLLNTFPTLFYASSDSVYSGDIKIDYIGKEIPYDFKVECSAGETKSCGTDVGECQSGIKYCQEDRWTGCVGPVYPVNEICDGKDNDCDGQTDEYLECVGTTQKEKCYDPDGGQNANVKSTITPGSDASMYSLKTDSCVVKESMGYSQVSYCSGDNCFVDEAYCTSLYASDDRIIQCHYGCKDGACLEKKIVEPKITNFNIAVGENSPVSDVRAAIDLADFLAEKGYLENGVESSNGINVIPVGLTLLFGDVNFNNYERGSVVLIDNNRALVVIGDYASTEHAGLANDAKGFLEKNGYEVTFILTSDTKNRHPLTLLDEILGKNEDVGIHVDICPVAMCAQPPVNCYYERSDELNSNGCPAFPCGVMVCNEITTTDVRTLTFPENTVEEIHPNIDNRPTEVIREVIKEIIVEKEVCNGCDVDGTCYPQGARVRDSYCDYDGGLDTQKAEGLACQNDFECTTNECSSGKCVDLQKQLIEQQKQLDEQAGLIQRIVNWLGKWF